MDKHSVSFQMFLIVLSFIYCSWFGKPNFCGSTDIVLKQCQRNTPFYTEYWFYFFLGGEEHAQKPKLHTALRLVQFLASFISFYFEILSYLACIKKIIKLASKNSVKLGKNQI